MAAKLDYTAQAQRFTAKFPVTSYVGIQVNFWIIANLMIAVILHLQSLMISGMVEIPVSIGLGVVIAVAIILGILYGVILGLADYYLDKKVFRKQSLGKVILLKTVLSLGTLLLLMFLVRFVLFDLFISPGVIILDHSTWKYLFYILVVYYFFMTLIISFINQVNKKYGPGVLVPLLLGKYRNPREEERIFMFMDLRSSTATAEKLGHLKYSSFIRDCFMDINDVLLPYRAEVYQYVGDEIVVTWREAEGLKDYSCIRFFFSCKQQFHDREKYYQSKYGFLPDFKGGLHMGKVTAVEIGEIKRDIAYHGDTLNTAARIQSVCNEFGRSFLVSDYLLGRIGLNQNLKAEALGMILLRGKTARIGIFSVDWIKTGVQPENTTNTSIPGE